MNAILTQLNTMPIFRLSLGSKELFHSNFLEFMWDMDRAMFIRIINRLLPTGLCLPENISYSFHELSREKENFDICIYHYIKIKDKEHIVYDLIIENKVKSIPSKTQLDDYVKKVLRNKWNRECPPRYILLTLVDVFADKDEIENEKVWTIANYNDLKKAIEQEQSSFCTKVGATYVKDYCLFIEQLHKLQRLILTNFETSQLFGDVEEYKQCRMHDLYIKLRCCHFLMLLKDRIEKQGLPVSFIKEHKNIRAKHIPQVYLNYNIYSGVGQAAAWLYTSTSNSIDDNIHEIVIQGNQYRHGINSYRYALKDVDKIQSQQNIWNELNKNQFDADFLQILKKPEKAKKNRNNAFNGYGNEYIYRYDLINKETVADLLNKMVDDITTVYRHYVPHICATTNEKP